MDKDKKEEMPVEKKEKIIKTFIAPKTDLYGVYLKEKQKLIIEELS